MNPTQITHLRIDSGEFDPFPPAIEFRSRFAISISKIIFDIRINWLVIGSSGFLIKLDNRDVDIIR